MKGPVVVNLTSLEFLVTFVSVNLMLRFGLCKDAYNVYNGPYFASKANTYRQKVGNSVELFCQVENLGSSTVIWKQSKSNRIISAGGNVIRKDDRLSLKGFNLSISDLKEADSGEYVCEIETYGSPLSQTSALEVLVPPTVNSLPLDGNLVVRKGSTVTLECAADGNPKPKITWHRMNNVLPSGEKSLESRTVIIQDLTRQHTGTYVCTANNGVGASASAEINLKVLYPPEIEISHSWIRTSDGIEAEISCFVHSDPKADVKWYKDTMLLDPNNNHHMEMYGNRHLLTIRSVRETDFGNYSCMADNSLGRQRGTVEVSGRPHVSKIISPSLSFYKDQYNLTWTTDSFLPIEEYRILYRVSKPTYVHHYYGGGNEVQQHGVHPVEWTNIIPTIDDMKPSALYRNSFTYTASFIFYGLTPSTEYEIIIQSRNKEGWSNASDIFKFSTRDKDFDPMELASPDKQGFFSQGTQITAAATNLVIAVLLHWV